LGPSASSSGRIDILRGVKIPSKACSVLLLAALAGTACAQTFGTAAAVVNGHRITDKELKAEVATILANPSSAGTTPEAAARQAILTLIENELVNEVAKQRHIVPTADDIDKALANLRAQAQLLDDATFQAQLKAAGLTLAGLRDQLKNKLVADRLKAALAPPVTDDQVRQVYEHEQVQFQQIMVEHILFQVSPTKTDAQALKQAKDALAQLKAGANFATLAKKLSDDTGSKATGGKIDQWLSVADPNLDQSFARAAEAAPIGKLTGPVRSQFGYHIIVTLKKRTQPLAEVQDSIRTQLEGQAGQTELADFANSLVKKAKIVINPRYGDWDPTSESIVAHQFFRPAPGESPTPTPSDQLTGAPQPAVTP
jgi:parvulin-like peptidyl-prolyl isomerase